jgi:hypothetical protein
LAGLAAAVAIGVFGLFHPREVEIEPWGTSRVEVRCGGSAVRVLEGSRRARLGSNCTSAGLKGAETDFVLSVPGKIRRHYRGLLKTTRDPNGELIAVVTMTLETAVASTVAAEAPPDAAPAMLEAQAIVSRSYFAAGRGRHRAFDFCDTTHCQFVRDPPAEESPAGRAARVTVGQVLSYREHVFAAFYAARCEGLLGPLPAERVGPDDYPYFAVRCEYCLRHPLKVEAKANARPHHHGMCQIGASDLAGHGWTAARILAQYYPGAELR